MASALGTAKHYVVTQFKRAIRKTRASIKSKERVEREFRDKYFAEIPVHIEAIDDFRVENFPDCGPYPWLDRPDALGQIDKKLAAGILTDNEAAQCRKWVNDGYIIIPNSVPDTKLDEMWAAYEKAAACGKIKIPIEPAGDGDIFPGRFLNPHLKVKQLDDLLRHATFDYWNRLLIGIEPVPFQTITAHKGSQQKTHSDTIHMTSYPLGYLTAAWVAFEDIHPDSGPLVYYPGSHKLPYQVSQAAGILAGEWMQSSSAYAAKYEPFVERLIEREKLKPHYFCAKKGETLIWHANLLHGGSPRKDYKHSRKSVVCHYFFKGAFSYHDLAGVAADTERKKVDDTSLDDMLM